MRTRDRLHPLVLALGTVLAAGWMHPGRCADQANTVLGATNPALADGSLALQSGRIEEGLRLTLEGLKAASAPADFAAGHSNACAGLVLLMRLDEALEHCNQAILLDAGNWHAYNNRAAIYAAKGLYDLAIQDLKTGLALAPRSATLHTSLDIVEKDKQLMLRQARKAVAS
jgi:tetratricopeptide (TPR) repeat protein